VGRGRARVSPFKDEEERRAFHAERKRQLADIRDRTTFWVDGPRFRADVDEDHFQDPIPTDLKVGLGPFMIFCADLAIGHLARHRAKRVLGLANLVLG
jgi:hypothetical protein